MSASYAMTAFVQTPPSVRRAVVSNVFSQAPTVLNGAASKVARVAVKSVMDPATKSAALAFFNGVRTPASLILGVSIAALFSMTQMMKNIGTLTKREILLLRMYHAVSLLTVCLSTATVLTSTTAGTLLLLNKFDVADPAIDVYHFLKSAMGFEFVLTRWTFLTSQLLFLVSLTGRTMLEFNLLTRKRLLPAVMTLATMSGMITLMLSYVNTTLNCWPNLLSMTKEVGMLLWQRAITYKHPLQIVSMVCFGVAAVCSLFLRPGTAKHQRSSPTKSAVHSEVEIPSEGSE